MKAVVYISYESGHILHIYRMKAVIYILYESGHISYIYRMKAVVYLSYGSGCMSYICRMKAVVHISYENGHISYIQGQLVTAERHLLPKCTNFLVFTTKVYEFWCFYHQSVRNIVFFYGTVQILGRHVTSRTPLAVHLCVYISYESGHISYIYLRK